MSKNLLAAFAIVATAALGVSPARAQDSKLTAALLSDVPSLDPTLDLSLHGFNFRLNVYDQLTETRADGSIGERLATSWESSPDAKTWTFTIRTDVKFHDKSALTVED